MNWISGAFDFLVKGGPAMVPLIACSVVSVTVIVDRWIALRTSLADKTDLSSKVANLLYNKEADKAEELCNSDGGPIAAMMAAGISNRQLGPLAAERAMIDEAAKETHNLTARLWLLDTIITIAPLLGLLGTVVGMIRSFHIISTEEGISTPTAITGGVAEALIATGTGLAIAIVTLIFYNAINEKVKQVNRVMESSGTSLLNVLTDVRERGDEITVLSA